MAYIDPTGYGGTRRSDHGRIAEQLKQAVVKINAVVDFDSVAIRREQGGKGQALYPFMNLPDTPSESQFAVHNGNIAFTLRQTAGNGRSSAPQRPRKYGTSLGGVGGGTGLALDVRVPVNATVNGLGRRAGAGGVATVAEAMLELESEIVPVGLIAEQNRNNGENMFGTQHGGTMTYTNNSTRDHNAYDLLRAALPDPNRMDEYPSSSVDADRVKSGGRVELIFERYDPHSLNVANVDRVIALLNRARSAAGTKPVAPHERTLLKDMIRGMVGIRNVVDAIINGNADNVNVLNAALANGATDAQWIAAFTLFHTRFDADRGAANGFNGWANMINALAAWKWEETRLVLGQALLPCASGGDGVIHIGSYMV
jgi:hypothetical protein